MSEPSVECPPGPLAVAPFFSAGLFIAVKILLESHLCRESQLRIRPEAVAESAFAVGVLFFARNQR